MSQRQSQDECKKQFHKLLQEIRLNPHKGLKKFYDAYGALIQSTARTICRNKEKADEVVDDVLVKIWQNASVIDKVNNPRGWVYIITANTAKDALRKRIDLPLNEYVLSSEDEIRKFIDEDSFCSLIQDLSETEQQVLIHKFISMLTFQEIADEIEKPLTTVTSIYYRALSKIKKNIEYSR